MIIFQQMFVIQWSLVKKMSCRLDEKCPLSLNSVITPKTIEYKKLGWEKVIILVSLLWLDYTMSSTTTSNEGGPGINHVCI